MKIWECKLLAHMRCMEIGASAGFHKVMPKNDKVEHQMFTL